MNIKDQKDNILMKIKEPIPKDRVMDNTMDELDDIIYVLWEYQNDKIKECYFIGRIERKGPDCYTFTYEKDNPLFAVKKGFKLFPEFADTNKEYTSSKLFNTFASRLPNRNRKDIANILKKYDLLEYDEFNLLREGHGILPIDNLIFI